MTKSNSTEKTANQELRIIAGKWRHRKISFYAQAGARPTLDRVRETVFNWLQPYVIDSSCLDLFAGSGIMGIEALSRGAKNTVFIDNQHKSIEFIQAALNKFVPERHQDTLKNCVASQLPQALSQMPNYKFDIIFLDPPYHTDLLQLSLDEILERNLLAKSGVIYFEAGKQDKMDLSGWEMLKHKSTKTLQYGLLKLID